MAHRVIPFLQHLRAAASHITPYKTEAARQRYIDECITESQLQSEPNCAIIFTIEYLSVHCQEAVITRERIHRYLDRRFTADEVDRHLNYLIQSAGILKESSRDNRLSIVL